MSSYLKSAEDFLEGIIRPGSRFFNTVSAVILAIMPLPVFFDVVYRLTFRGSIPGVIEIEEFMMVFVVYFALAFTQIDEGHIRIDLLLIKMPQWVQNIINSAIYLLVLVFVVLMCTQLFRMGVDKFQMQAVSMALEIPLWIFRFAAGLGAIILIGVVLLDFIKSLRRSIEDRRWAWLALALAASCLLLIIPFAGMVPFEMSGASIGIFGMCLLFFLLFLGMPIGFGMGLAGLIGLLILYKGVPPALANLGIASYSGAASYMLTVVPMFILMGELAYQSGISKDLFATANTWLGRLRGGLAMSSVAGCAGFSAVCGDSLATAVTMGTIAVPEMKKKKYAMRLATGCLAAGGTLGILIPPSVGFIFYAIVTEESIGKLFIAGFVPGLLLAVLFILTIWIMARIRPDTAPRGEATTLKEKLFSLKGVIGMLVLFILILGGIIAGIFSPVEGGAIGAVGAFVYALVMRRLTWKMIVKALEDTLKITTKLLMILIGVGILGYFLASTRLPFALADFVTGFEVNRYFVFFAVIVLFIILGCLLNVIPMILLVLPTIFPSIVALGFDPIWFGVVCVITMEMGQITPPIGVNVFAIGSVAKEVPMQVIFRGIVPFFFCMVLCVLLLVLFPQIALFLPGLLF
jgi:tripartite ATP-independent transporter DctM subunit